MSTHFRRTSLLIVQPYVPAYRVPLFAGMREALADEGIDMRIAAGRPHGAAELRGDNHTESVADYALTERHFRIGDRGMIIRSVGPALAAPRPDLIVVEQAIKNLETYRFLARAAIRRDVRVAMWGQGRSYSVGQSYIEAAAKQWLTRRSDWFFAYTARGAEHVVENGFDHRRITILNNTIDADALRRNLESVSPEETECFRRRLGLAEGRTAVFVGGVDAGKGIDFLLDSAGEVSRLLPGFTLLVVGAGRQEQSVRRIETRGGPVRFLGRLDGREKAIALAAADVLMVPQWVGLVAVDSLVAGRPIVTTVHPSHSPEFEYLRPNQNAVVTTHSVDDYAAGVADLLIDVDRLRRLQQGARADSSAHDVRGMVNRFVKGILEWRGSGR